MTVRELRNKLQGLPEDAVIVFTQDDELCQFLEVKRLDEGFYSQEHYEAKMGMFYTYDQPDIKGLQRAVCLFDFETGNKW